MNTSFPRTIEYLTKLGLVALAVLVFGGLGTHFSRAREYWGYFAQSRFSYDNFRLGHPGIGTGLLAARYLPDGAHVDWAAQQDVVTLGIRYGVYPVATQDRENPSYVIDATGSEAKRCAQWLRQPLLNGSVLYAKAGAPLLDRGPATSFPARRAVVAFLLSLFFDVLLGAAILAALGMDARRGGAAWFAGAALLVGMTAWTGLVWAGMLLGLRLGLVWMLAAWGGGFAAAIAVLRRGGVTLGLREGLRALRPEGVAGWAIAAAGLAMLVLVCLPTVLSPVVSWDAMSHWMFKAKALLFHRALDFSADTHHNEYPLLWPLHTAMQYVLAGGACDQIAKWMVVLLYLALLSQIHGALRFLGASANAAWAAVGLFPVFFFDDSLQWAYAEVALIALLAAMLAALSAAGDDPERAGRWHALAVLLGCGVAATKFEGGPMCLIVAAAAVLSHPQFPRSRQPWALGALLAAPVLITLGWYLYQRGHGYLDAGHLREPLTLAKCRLLWDSVLGSVAGRAPGWRLFAGAGLVLLLAGKRASWRRMDLLLGICAGGLVVFTMVALLGWSAKDISTATLTATPRLALHAAPALLILFLSLLSRAVHGAGPEREESPNQCEN